MCQPSNHLTNWCYFLLSPRVPLPSEPPPPPPPQDGPTYEEMKTKIYIIRYNNKNLIIQVVILLILILAAAAAITFIILRVNKDKEEAASMYNCTVVYRWLYTYSPIFWIEFVSKLSRQSLLMVGRRWNWLSWQFTDKLDANFVVGRRWKWLSWQFTDKLDSKYWGVSVKSPVSHRRTGSAIALYHSKSQQRGGSKYVELAQPLPFSHSPVVSTVPVLEMSGTQFRVHFVCAEMYF